MFGGNDAIAKRQLQVQEESQAQDYEAKMSQQMFDPNKVGLDSQVSALILEMNARFLKYDVDYDNRQLLCKEKFSFLEPWGEESRCFLEGNNPKIVALIDMLLSEEHSYSGKYDEDLSKSFNEVVRVRQSILNLSRATGKAAKVAKSQYVESSANIRRDLVSGQKKSKGMLGLGIMGL